MDNWLGAGRIKPRIIFRFVTIGLLSMGFLFYRFFYKEYSTDCYNDAWHDFTAELNHHLDQNGADNVVIGIGQVFMDFWIIAISAFWLAKLKNARVPLAAALFFLCRFIFLALLAFPFPDHIVWHSPGFLSLTVPYDRTRDFFYSGHTGSLTVIIVEFYTVGHRWFSLIPLTCLIYMMNMLLITRVHYTIDVAAGLVFSLFFHGVAGKWVYYFDWLLSLPYLLARTFIAKCRRYTSGHTDRKSSLEDLILANDRSI